jgi:hypothetical protein
MSAPNPYEPPQTPAVPARPSRKNKLAMWVMGALSLPAGITAFCLACSATYVVFDPGGGVAGPIMAASFIVGGIVGALVMGVMLYLAVFRKPKQ